ncbi:MAG: ATP-dependent DNA helicase RecG, partial [Patescibacteria group bacterium]|nr:ATP-dependent DNA helicase RecG [Patescibacteria group bacterium]
MFHFDDPVTKFPNTTQTRAKKIQTLNIYTVHDLLYHFPFRYEDYSIFKTISEIEVNETVTIQGVVKKVTRSRTFRKKMAITEIYIEDHTGMIKAVWFNVFGPLRFLAENKYVQISGKVSLDKKNELYFQHPNFELINKHQFESQKKDVGDQLAATGALIPIYPETRGITSYWLRAMIKKILSRVQFVDPIPYEILKTQKLPPIDKALEIIHFPSSLEEAGTAKKRFAFEKLFMMQFKALSIKQQWEKNRAVKIPFSKTTITSFVKSLPFALTNAQRKSAWQIIKDMEKAKPMNRLLEGDVGSGKTVVAAMAALSVITRKHQVALLAPTEVLALQHFKEFLSLFNSKKHSVALLTSAHSKISGNSLDKKTLKSKLRNGNIDIVIGTHALLQQSVSFKDLALVIVDEQHRFGVKQRAYLQQQTITVDDGEDKKIPHFLTMTATPIPRTLSLAIFGNLELSIMDEYPKGRKKISTKVIQSQGREQIYTFIKKEIRSGRQAFIIYPLVSETSKMSEVKAATEEHKTLQEKIFPEFKSALLHGKMKPKEKEEIMRQFKDGTYDFLVATSVVEVGIDVPNATIMVIEG